MVVHASRSLRIGLQAATVLAGLAAVGCVPRYTAPVQLAASNPTVTYQYRNDAELLEANQNAAAFCSQYQSTPRTAHIDEAPDARVVVFECVQGMPVAGPVVTTTYNGYYDDYYGPYYDGYWGADGFFYFTDGPGHAYRRDDLHHFRRDMVPGYHGVRGSVHG